MRLALLSLIVAFLWEAWLFTERVRFKMPLGDLIESAFSVGLAGLCLGLLWVNPVASLTLLSVLVVMSGVEFWIAGFDLGNEIDRNAAVTLCCFGIAVIGLVTHLWMAHRAGQLDKIDKRDLRGPLFRIAQISLFAALLWDCADIANNILARLGSGSWVDQLRISPLVFLIMLWTTKAAPTVALTLTGLLGLAIVGGVIFDAQFSVWSIRLLGYGSLLCIAFVSLLVPYLRARKQSRLDKETREAFG